MLYRPLEVTDMDYWEEQSQNDLIYLREKMSRVTVGAAKPAALFCDNESAVKICAYVVPNSNEGVLLGEKFLAILFTDLQRLSRSRNYLNSRFRCDTNTYSY